MARPLFMGGEDIDFPDGTFPISDTTAGHYRAFARCAVRTAAVNTMARSDAFLDGAQTSAWLSFWANTGNGVAASRACGFGLSSSGTALPKGFGVGWNGSGQTILYKFDGTTATTLATDTTSGFTMVVNNTHQYWMQVVNFGATATVNIYFDANLVITGTFDLTVTGMTTDFDCVTIGPNPSFVYLSEIFSTIEDPRLYPLMQTRAMVAAGTTSNWSGNTVGNINGTSVSTLSPENSNTNAQEQQWTQTAPTTGNFQVVACKRSAYVAVSAGAAVGKIALGWRNVTTGNATGYGTGATKTLTAGQWQTIEQIDATDPCAGGSGGAWNYTDLAAQQSSIKAVT